ncbi:hypothetical protein H4R18_004741 [Coemansia javaensis]|uniref:Uncharacterized protein n=1 Tax=Coemansia javaensis TaxID=2761396 RepID=A0A9W8H5B8_9FUNG|nr:hypothetical protein H4R18_004741 [Coemansia javaensis]
MANFASILDASARKSILVTGCDMYSGYQIVVEALKRKGTGFGRVYATFFEENHLVEHLQKLGAECIKLAIADGAETIAKAYSKADVVVVVPAFSDKHWGEGGCVFVSAVAHAGVHGLALCSAIGAEHMEGLQMLAPLRKMEEAFERVKGKVKAASLVRCSLHIDMLWLFRRQIASEHAICLSASPSAKFAPAAGADCARGLCNMIVDPRFEPRTYVLTGPETVDFEAVARCAAGAIDESIHYKQVDRKEMAMYLEKQGEMCTNAIAVVGDTLAAVSKGLLDKQCRDLAELLGKQPMSVGAYLEKNASDFKP